MKKQEKKRKKKDTKRKREKVRVIKKVHVEVVSMITPKGYIK